MKTFILLALVFLSGCFKPVEDTVQIKKMDPEKRKAAEMIASQIETVMERMSEEQMKMQMVLTVIQKDLAEDGEWVRSDREVDPTEIYRF